jgi:membrane protease YdiL (CAAX protease family)
VCLLISICDMLVFAPVREEMTFRGLMFAIFYLRGTSFKLAPAVALEGELKNAPAVSPDAQESLAWTSSWKLDCVAASAVTFGLVHLLNVFGSRYTRTYILLQVLLGMTLGAFYSLRLVLSEHAVLETALLHIINNAFSR